MAKKGTRDYPGKGARCDWLIECAVAEANGLRSSNPYQDARMEETFKSQNNRTFFPVSSYPELFAALRDSKFVRLLRKSIRDANPEQYKAVLLDFLRELRVAPPPRVITPFRGDPGARQTKTNKQLCWQWELDGRPEITSALCDKYAEKFYPTNHAKAKPSTKPYKNLISKIRTPLLNYKKKQPATNFSR